jgi:hypothetical protein
VAKYGVYEEADGFLWVVHPATKKNAEKEAKRIGPGYRAVKVKLGKKLSLAFQQGRNSALKNSR